MFVITLAPLTLKIIIQSVQHLQVLINILLEFTFYNYSATNKK